MSEQDDGQQRDAGHQAANPNNSNQFSGHGRDGGAMWRGCALLGTGKVVQQALLDHASLAADRSAGVVKRCGCGAEYTEATWAALPDRQYWGRIAGEESGRLEMRRCGCGSRITRRV